MPPTWPNDALLLLQFHDASHERQRLLEEERDRERTQHGRGLDLDFGS
jgi:hypothetical protein